jgi:PAS domain S-box-containing protein
MEKKDTIKSRINPNTTKAMGISPQKLPEDISANEQRYRELVEHLPLGIAILLDGKLMFLNISGALMMAAEKPEDMVGRDFMEFVHPDYQEIVSNRLLKVQRGEIAPASEQKYIRLDGRVIDVEVSSYPFVFHNKPAVQIIVKDITEQKESRLAVKKTETLFSQLFHVSPMAIAMLDNEGHVAQVNPGFEKMFGYTFEELKGQELNQTIVPDSLESEGNDLNTLISTQQVVRIETKRKRKDGVMLSVIIYGLPVHFEDKTIGIFGVYVDITEQKKVEEELKVRNTELDNFVYKVSHDLRAPLSSVLGLINLARLPGNDDNLKDYFGVIEKKVNQLDHFITDVLSHSKNLKLDVIIEAIDFQELIDQTFVDLSYLKGAEQIERSIVVEGTVFFSDRWRIAEIFRNLVSNAIKYRDFTKINPEISVTIAIDETQAVITFKDNGIGIERHNLEKIFNMFYRASEQSDGSGLGLYIVKNATDKLRGEVQVTSKLGEGTSFVISLPNRAPVLTE